MKSSPCADRMKRRPGSIGSPPAAEDTRAADDRQRPSPDSTGKRARTTAATRRSVLSPARVTARRKDLCWVAEPVAAIAIAASSWRSSQARAPILRPEVRAGRRSPPPPRCPQATVLDRRHLASTPTRLPTHRTKRSGASDPARAPTRTRDGNVGGEVRFRRGVTMKTPLLAAAIAIAAPLCAQSQASLSSISPPCPSGTGAPNLTTTLLPRIVTDRRSASRSTIRPVRSVRAASSGSRSCSSAFSRRAPGSACPASASSAAARSA